MKLIELQLGLNKVPWKNLFVQDMRRLGENLWLARFTEDKVGKSRVHYLGLIRWHEERDAFVIVGRAKRNRYHWGHKAIDLFVSNSSYLLNGSYDEVRNVQIYLPDTDEEWYRSASMLVINGRLILPSEVFDEHDDNLRFPDYGNIISA